MPAPTVVSDFLDCVRKSSVADPKDLDAFVAGAKADGAATPAQMADALVREGLLTRFQADQMLRGRWRNFILSGKYTILEPLGAGGMGTVYLCFHKIMRRAVAVKVLPASQADDPSAVERFHREAQAVAQLRHPNIVGAHDIDRDGKFHFLVMEYVDGVSLQELVRRRGPLDPVRAAHYIHQAALGLQHAHEAAGLVHRDIKPANLLVDRLGVVKILDLGLARFFHDKKESLTQKYDGNAVLGTADYLAPEQAVDSHNVDIRCDIYSLGITFYFLLAGHSPFQEGSVAEKLIWHQVRQPKPIREVRPEVPEGVAAVLEKMIAKEPAQRYQTPAEVAEALAPWTQTPIDPPSDKDIPQITAAARRAGVSEANYTTPRTPSPRTPTPRPVKPASGGLRSSAVSGETNPGTEGLTGAIPTRVTMKSVLGAPSSHRDGKSQEAGADVAHPRGVPWAAVAAVTVIGLLVLAGAGVAVALSFLRPAESGRPVAFTPPVRDQGAAPLPPPPPPQKDIPHPLTPVSGVAVAQDNDGLHFRTANYEALVDPEGCLNSLRVGGVEFLGSGEPVGPQGKTTAKGTYFYCDKAGHQGVVKMPHIERPVDNVVVASGDKFSVRYEFRPEEVVLKPNNNTDDTAPFYFILDGASVTDVLVGPDGHRLSVPVARKPSDPPDPAWQTSTWIAGRSRLTISDGTRVWGPWGKLGNLQVWERSIPTYGSAEIHLTPTVAATEQEAAVPPGGVVLTRRYTTRRVRSDLYEAVIEDDGCLSSLRVDGVEFLHPGLDVSRGSYFLHGPPQRLTDIRQPAANVLTADGANASIRYEFAPDKMTWTLESKSNDGMPFFIVFDAGVLAARVGADAWLKAPGANQVIADPNTTSVAWYAGRARVTLTGGNRVWGPWQTKYQVWEVSMAPHDKRTVTVELARAPADEVEKAAAMAGVPPPAASEMALYGPLDYEVFQRRTRTQGDIQVRGRVHADFDRVEWRLTGKPLEGAAPSEWQALPPPNPPPTRGEGRVGEARAFDATLPVPAGGWYKLEVRALKDGKEVAAGAVGHVGVGEVFVGAGQSNSTNCGQEKIQQHTGLVSSFSGTYWQPADDPQVGAHDQSVGGSFWPAFGDAMAEKYHVPIGVASTGHSGTSINQWQPGAGDGLFDWTTERMNELGNGGFRAVLWHQGESDTSMPSDEYREKLTNLIEKSRGAAGWDAPWFVAQVSYHNPTDVSTASTRDAQQKLWQTGVALEGPDTDALTGDNRDNNGQGIHFSPKGLAAHGHMWADKVGVWLDKVLAK